MKAHQHLRRLLSRRHPPDEYHWHHVLAIMDVVTSEKTPEHEVVLREVAEFQGCLKLDTRHGLPHAMPPEDLLRNLAVQTLADWDHRKHRHLIRRVADRAEREVVKEVAKVAAEPRRRKG